MRTLKRCLIEVIKVPASEPDKPVVDRFRYRNKIGLDIAPVGLRKGPGGERFTRPTL